MGLGTMSQIPPEALHQLCIFCKSEREIKPRCRGCDKLLANMLSSPYSISCPRCKLRRTVGNPERISHSQR